MSKMPSLSRDTDVTKFGGENVQMIAADQTLHISIAHDISRVKPLDTCKPQRKIAFAKTHKTASSTVQNILLRYGLAIGAEFLLPWSNNYLGSMLNPFTVEQMDKADQRKVPWHRTLRRSSGGYDISCFHCKWNNTAMRFYSILA